MNLNGFWTVLFIVSKIFNQSAHIAGTIKHNFNRCCFNKAILIISTLVPLNFGILLQFNLFVVLSFISFILVNLLSFNESYSSFITIPCNSLLVEVKILITVVLCSRFFPATIPSRCTISYKCRTLPNKWCTISTNVCFF